MEDKLNEFINNLRQSNALNKSKPVKLSKTVKVYPYLNECVIVESHKKCCAGGYSQIRINKKQYMTTRLIYKVFNGEIPEDMVIRHKCDNPKCVNIEHLEIGTTKENVNDMIVRNRRSNRNGSSNPNSLLNEVEVIRILQDYIKGMRVKEIYRKYNIKFSLAQSIVHDKNSWVNLKQKIKYEEEKIKRKMSVIL